MDIERIVMKFEIGAMLILIRRHSIWQENEKHKYKTFPEFRRSLSRKMNARSPI